MPRLVTFQRLPFCRYFNFYFNFFSAHSFRSLDDTRLSDYLGCSSTCRYGDQHLPVGLHDHFVAMAAQSSDGTSMHIMPLHQSFYFLVQCASTSPDSNLLDFYSTTSAQCPPTIQVHLLLRTTQVQQQQQQQQHPILLWRRLQLLQPLQFQLRQDRLQTVQFQFRPQRLQTV